MFAFYLIICVLFLTGSVWFFLYKEDTIGQETEVSVLITLVTLFWPVFLLFGVLYLTLKWVNDESIT